MTIPQNGGGFGVPADWYSKDAGTESFGGLVAATRPKVTENVVHADKDGLGGFLSYVRIRKAPPR